MDALKRLVSFRDGRPRNDDGALVATSMVGALLFALLCMVLITRVATAGNTRDTSQYASDAAALAGAESIRETLMPLGQASFATTAEFQSLLPLRGTCLQYGEADAAAYARMNDATLSGYCWNTFTGKVWASAPSTGSEGTADTESYAALDTDLYSCYLSPLPVVAPAPEPDPAPTEPPVPGEPVPTPVYTDGPLPTLICDGAVFELDFDLFQPGPLPRYVLRDPQRLRLALEERLVSGP